MSKLKILALDTSTEACSAALLAKGSAQSRYQYAPRQHTQLILPMLQSLLDDAQITLKQLDVLAFCQGPGSFTGSRIAASIIQALAFALDKPVVGVSTLHCLAQGAYRTLQATQIFAAMDARMNQVYWGTYVLGAQNLLEVRDPDQISNLTAIKPACFEKGVGVGSAWPVYGLFLAEQLKQQLQGCALQRYPSAYDILALAEQAYERGEGVSAEKALPVYLREKVV
ncbi:tRNA (adenosine(37)-N6)-threonylcarbamoyltransferase complex dimerization subunit type 1 TsaB [Rickettsiella massiliensis]|uniref:tRNA (adenosine(37)-N6)-threonylcarbamoyltransferase complex dimerization subunit type 1 TsaB n=1 Tax=Rickettsiella massiliensis TaxID=676517 RepID=UPI00029AD70E|nr:tRNA (adenosine(37)-N6)-threonylcarbamoyltransferase complex dimerization subunit type 1 TsaB [Rickettsiella massiliensis]